jgi:hypothetical protein
MPRPSLSDGVFVNCPFDDDYEPVFRSMVFCIYACGFRVRSAKEVEDGSELRFRKIVKIIRECRYGIHDLSRTELDRHYNLPRFNMPLELGLFLGAKYAGAAGQSEKQALIFDKEQYRYQRFISDLAGMDIVAHYSDPGVVIRQIRNWLANVSRRQIDSGERIARLYLDFSERLPYMARQLEFDPDSIPYVDFERFVVGWLTPGAN